MMKTFDYEQVSTTLSPLKAKLQDCAHGEGNQCETLDKHLDCCAEICFEVHAAVVTWAQNVFAGKIAFDREAENLWRAEVAQIYAQAKRVWQVGRKAQVPCWDLPGQSKLETALWYLNFLLQDWVSPRQSVAPSARVALQLTEEQSSAIRQQLANLPAASKAPAAGR
jgi:hypothetical protein